MFLGVSLFSNFSQPFRGEAMREVESDPLESADRVQVLAPWPWGAAQDAWPLRASVCSLVKWRGRGVTC